MFHKDYGHDTNDCVTLKDEIKSLIRKRKLTNYNCYCDQHEEGGKEREWVRSRSPKQRELSDRVD